jgi:hypothetical protein
MAVTYDIANKIQGLLFGQTSYTPPTTWYLGVSTSTIQSDGSGITEPTDTAYARIAIPNLTTSFTTPVNGMIQNKVAFQFPESLVSWGTVTDFFLSTSASDGSIEFYGKLTLSRNVETGTVLLLSIGALEMTMTNA